MAPGLSGSQYRRDHVADAYCRSTTAANTTFQRWPKGRDNDANATIELSYSWVSLR